MAIEELKKQYLREKFLIERRIGYKITTSFERWLEIKNMQDKNGKYYRCHNASQLACEHFEQANND